MEIITSNTITSNRKTYVGTTGRDGHMGLGTLHGTWWDIPISPIPSQWYNGTGWTHGIGHTAWYMVGHPIQSHPLPMVQWDGMDTWDWAHCMVHGGTSHSVPSPPNGTTGRDGNMGLGTLHGTWWDIPFGPIPSQWYNGTGWTHGIGHTAWDIPLVSPNMVHKGTPKVPMDSRWQCWTTLTRRKPQEDKMCNFDACRTLLIQSSSP